jgi:hypothetical protein
MEDSVPARSLGTSKSKELDAPVKIRQAAGGFAALRCLPRDAYPPIVTDIDMAYLHARELVTP